MSSPDAAIPIRAHVSRIASWASAFYVERVVSVGGTSGRVDASIGCLIRMSWNVNAVFFGGALATETEIALAEQAKFKGG